MSRADRCLAWTVAGAAAAIVLSASAPAASPASTETRGLWVTRATLAAPDSIAAMVRAAEGAGFNTLLVQVRGRGEAYYRSELEPRASDLDAQPTDFDPLATTLTLAHAAGLKVHAWVNVNLVASGTTLPRSRAHVVSRHPDWLMVPRALAAELSHVDPRSPAYLGQLARWTRAASEQVEGLYLSPATEDARTYTARVVEEIAAAYPVDGIHLDYIRYPGDQLDYGASTLEAFRASLLPGVPAADRQRLDRQAAASPLAWPTAYPDAFLDFRRDRVTALVDRIAAAVRTVRPSAVMSAAVVPHPDEARARRLQDWPQWARLGLLDVVCPMAYAQDLGTFTADVTRARTQAGATPLWVGVGAYRLPVARTVEHLRAARRAGANGLLVFSYDSIATAGAPYLAGLRPVLLESSGDAAPHR